MDRLLVEKLIFWSGMGHFGLCAASLYVPAALEWKKGLSSLKPLLRQMFWTYAGYILVINFCFGIVSVAGAGELLNTSFLARCVTLFIGIYWLSRTCIQFFYFDRAEAPEGIIYTIGEVLLVSAFIAFSIVYLLAFFINCAWI
ncbi:hypothetical protein WBG78_22595 [Chryseolinea sp. T2]|uniref:hypothetical protein n=1 Tax=Chryseolinea sp. T2 TaxID=3129255 RepID=UPI0030776D67